MRSSDNRDRDRDGYPPSSSAGAVRRRSPTPPPQNSVAYAAAVDPGQQEQQQSMATLYAAYVAALRSMHAPGAATYMQDQPTLQYQPQYPPQQPASYATYQPPPSHPVGGYEDHHRGIPAMEPAPPMPMGDARGYSPSPSRPIRHRRSPSLSPPPRQPYHHGRPRSPSPPRGGRHHYSDRHEGDDPGARGRRRTPDPYDGCRYPPDDGDRMGPAGNGGERRGTISQPCYFHFLDPTGCKFGETCRWAHCWKGQSNGGTFKPADLLEATSNKEAALWYLERIRTSYKGFINRHVDSYEQLKDTIKELKQANERRGPPPADDAGREKRARRT